MNIRDKKIIGLRAVRKEKERKKCTTSKMLQYKHRKTFEKMSAFFFRRREDVTKSGNSKSEADPIGKGLNIFIL
jgi:hypothetical protein